LVRRVDQFAPPNGTTISETAYALSAESCGICRVADLGHLNRVVVKRRRPYAGERDQNGTLLFPGFSFSRFFADQIVPEEQVAIDRIERRWVLRRRTDPLVPKFTVADESRRIPRLKVTTRPGTISARSRYSDPKWRRAPKRQLLGAMRLCPLRLKTRCALFLKIRCGRFEPSWPPILCYAALVSYRAALRISSSPSPATR
jgi:hypothetical protein